MHYGSFTEHSFLSPTATIADIESLCSEAKQYQVAAVCVPPMFVKKAKELIGEMNIKVATVIGFPYGYNAIEGKLAETVLAIVDGADELNVMINHIALKNNDWQYLAKEINTLLAVIRKSNKAIKVIIEAALLTKDEIIACCDVYGAASVDFIQISSGTSNNRLSFDTLELIRTHVADAIQLKCGDSIDVTSYYNWIEAGAARLVCKDIFYLDVPQLQ
ncbi:MAG: deoxyribose-phosphate aldolase [Bacteroidetes bacterium]|nr:deoxyribose-phosphate aldolase [Bacteroidota bacterium]